MNVSLAHVTKRFTLRGSPAVFDTSLTAEAGGITTLLGPSGSGKTTLLRIIAGLERPDQGQVLFDDRDVTHVPIHKRGLGFVFQAFALVPHMTVRRNIGFPLEVRKVAPKVRDQRIDELLTLVQLAGLGDRMPRQLSGGQRQRVGFARALALQPEVLLLDEPFGALDTRVRIELRHWVAELHRKTRLTTILVTHDQGEALQLSRRIVVMDQGKVVQVGTPREVYDQPKTPFVASFVGAANVLRGTVEGERAALGTLSLAAPAGAPQGAAVRAIVRPHEVRVTKGGQPASGSGAEPAPAGAQSFLPEPIAGGFGALNKTLGTITRIVGLGAVVKLHVALPSDQVVTAEVPRAEADRQAFAVGDRVVVDLREARVFVEDYTI